MTPPPPSPRLLRLPVFYGWVIVAAAFLTMAVRVNARTGFSLMFPAILDEFGGSRGVTAAAFGIGFLASSVYTPFMGLVMDRLGPRVLLPAGALLASAGLPLATLVNEPWQLHATFGVLVAGPTAAISYLGHSFFLPHWFVRRRGLALGLAFSGVGVGSVLLMPALQDLIGRAGWRAACWAMAAALVLVIVPLNLVVPRRHPQELGLGPDGDLPVEDRPGGRSSDDVVDRAWAAVDWTLGRAARTARFWWLALAYFTGLYAWYAVQVHQTKYLVEVGFAPSAAAWALGLVPLAGIVGQVALGHLSDRVGREWAWTLAGAGFALCYASLLALAGRPAPFLVGLVVAAQGMLGYGLASVFGAIPAELFQGRRYATIFATLNLASNAGAGAGPWVTGVLYDRSGSYRAAFLLALAMSVVSAIAVWLAAPRKVRAVAGRVRRG